MEAKRSRLAIIPARGGSKRIAEKNIRPFAGVPILHRTIQLAESSGLFDAIEVSTDSQKIAQVAAVAGRRPASLRPAELATDEVGLADVIAFEVERCERDGRRFDELWMILACAPLIVASDLVHAANLLSDSRQDVAVISVCEYPVPIEWALRVDHNGELSASSPEAAALPAHELPRALHDAGGFIGYHWGAARDVVANLRQQRFRGCELPWWRSVDIDTESDWAAAEALFASLNLER